MVWWPSRSCLMSLLAAPGSCLRLSGGGLDRSTLWRCFARSTTWCGCLGCYFLIFSSRQATAARHRSRLVGRVGLTLSRPCRGPVAGFVTGKPSLRGPNDRMEPCFGLADLVRGGSLGRARLLLSPGPAGAPDVFAGTWSGVRKKCPRLFRGRLIPRAFPRASAACWPSRNLAIFY